MMATKRNEEEEGLEEVSIATPFAKLAARGVRTSDLIGILTLCLVGVVLYFVLRTHDSAAEQRLVTAQRYSELGQIMKAQVHAQRMMTCIISIPPERREQEFLRDNSFCKQMSRVE